MSTLNFARPFYADPVFIPKTQSKYFYLKKFNGPKTYKFDAIKIE